MTPTTAATPLDGVQEVGDPILPSVAISQSRAETPAVTGAWIVRFVLLGLGVLVLGVARVR
jgi:hypothetical protein